MSTHLSGSRRQAAGISLVTAGSMAANAAGYFLSLTASRVLGPGGFGEFASLLAVQLVLAVPALALQAVVAREIVRGATEQAVRALAWRCAVVVTAVAGAAIPFIALALHTGLLAAGAGVATAPVLVLLAGEQGILQGHSRFRQLGMLFAAAGAARVAPAIAVLASGGGTAAALAASFAGTAILTAALGMRYWGWRRSGGGAAALAVLPVLHAAQAQGAVLALSSIDVLAAQLLLDRDSAGRYALGAVAAKIAFWLPQAVGVVVYPRLAHPQHSARALHTALTVLAGLGAIAVGAAAVAAPLASVAAGPGYAPIEGQLWAFALNGALLALLQAALLAGIARQHTRLALVVWTGLGIAAIVMVAGTTSVTSLLTITVITTAVITAIVCAAALWGPAGGAPARNGPDRRGHAI